MNIPYTIKRYPNSRFWAVYIDQTLVCVTVYKKGAMEVARLLNTHI